ncbi:MAG: ABC transporter substrate-binding protein [Flavobacteriaceae bacterium]|nr:ABC transporter substrate-binding protein [Flavobacteriaceae bacterium]
MFVKCLKRNQEIIKKLLIFKVLKYLIIVLYLSLLTNCSTLEKEDKTNVFRYNEHTNISSLDPAFAKNQSNIWAVNQIFSGLVQLDDSLKVQPDIAQSWTISDDGKVYEFHVRKDVFFHKHFKFGKDSTRTVKASDFVYSFNRLKDEQVTSPGGWVLKNVQNYTAENDSTFVITLKESFPPFLGLLTMKYCSVVPKEIVDFYGNDFRSNPIGTGPFQFKLWVENTKLVFRKNPLYYERDTKNIPLPYLEAVAITFLPDKQSEFMQFVQGNLDFISGLDTSYKDELLLKDGTLNPKYKSQINMNKSSYLNTEYLGFYLNEIDGKKPVHLLLRKAINYGFDRDKMMLFMRNGIGISAKHGIVPIGLTSSKNVIGYTYDIEKAKKLVKEYQKLTGDLNPIVTISTNSQYVDLCEYIQREVQKIGIDLKVEVMPPSTLKQAKATGKLAVFRGSWIADYPDAENYLSLFYSKNFAPDGPNYFHYKNELFDQYYEKSFSITDDVKRNLLYQKMDSLMMSSAPIVPLYYDEVLRFSQKNVNGLGLNPINLLNLKQVKKR